MTGRHLIGAVTTVTLCVTALVVSAPHPAGAGGGIINLEVTTTDDELDPGAVPGDDFSLREAVAYVNVQSQAFDYYVSLADAQTFYVLDLCPPGADNSNDVGDLNALPSVTFSIDGNGSRVEQTCSFTRVIRKPNPPGQLLLVDITLTGGNGALGGAAASAEGDLRVVDSVITGNQTPSAGGGLYTEADLFIEDSTLEANGASFGGAAYGDDSVTVERSIIRNNSSSTAGGIASGATMLIEDSIIEHNLAFNDGGGIWSDGNLTVINSTVTGNLAGHGTIPPNPANQGGGSYSEGTTTIESSTFAANRAPTGANVSSLGIAHINNSVVTLGSGSADCDLIGGGLLPNLVGGDQSCNGILTPVTELSRHPMTALPALNGGPNETMRLVEPSRAVDTYGSANPDSCALPTDQRGAVRPSGASCDAGAFEGVPLECTVAFPDVPASATFFEEICWLAQMGITGGFDDGEFKPTNTVTRQSMAAFLFRLALEPFVAISGDPFTDVNGAHPFEQEIEWLFHEEIAGGFADGGFHPADPVTRQAMAAFLYRIAGEPSFGVPPVQTFSDVPPDHPFFEEIAWLADSGVTNGFPDGTFRPSQEITREAMAAFLLRLASTVPLLGL